MKRVNIIEILAKGPDIKPSRSIDRSIVRSLTRLLYSIRIDHDRDVIYFYILLLIWSFSVATTFLIFIIFRRWTKKQRRRFYYLSSSPIIHAWNYFSQIWLTSVAMWTNLNFGKSQQENWCYFVDFTTYITK